MDAFSAILLLVAELAPAEGPSLPAWLSRMMEWLPVTAAFLSGIFLAALFLGRGLKGKQEEKSASRLEDREPGDTVSPGMTRLGPSPKDEAEESVGEVIGADDAEIFDVPFETLVEKARDLDLPPENPEPKPQPRERPDQEGVTAARQDSREKDLEKDLKNAHRRLEFRSSLEDHLTKAQREGLAAWFDFLLLDLQWHEAARDHINALKDGLADQAKKSAQAIPALAGTDNATLARERLGAFTQAAKTGLGWCGAVAHAVESRRQEAANAMKTVETLAKEDAAVTTGARRKCLLPLMEGDAELHQRLKEALELFTWLEKDALSRLNNLSRHPAMTSVHREGRNILDNTREARAALFGKLPSYHAPGLDIDELFRASTDHQGTATHEPGSSEDPAPETTPEPVTGETNPEPGPERPRLRVRDMVTVATPEARREAELARLKQDHARLVGTLTDRETELSTLREELEQAKKEQEEAREAAAREAAAAAAAAAAQPKEPKPSGADTTAKAGDLPAWKLPVLKFTGVMPGTRVTPARDEMVIFRGDNPKCWNPAEEINQPDTFALPLNQVPRGISYLRLRRLDTGESVAVPVTLESLTNGLADHGGYGWNSRGERESGGYHLGIFDRRVSSQVATHDDAGGWGFGHSGVAGSGQAYAWEGGEIWPTQFEILVGSDPRDASGVGPEPEPEVEGPVEPVAAPTPAPAPESGPAASAVSDAGQEAAPGLGVVESPFEEDTGPEPEAAPAPVAESPPEIAPEPKRSIPPDPFGPPPEPIRETGPKSKTASGPAASIAAVAALAETLPKSPPEPPTLAMGEELVIFRSNDPLLWNQSVYRGANQRARSLGDLPKEIKYLRLRRCDTGESVLVPVNREHLLRPALQQLNENGADNRRAFGFNATNEHFYGAYHLGVYERSLPQEVETRFTYGGWGFGHLNAREEAQGFAWEGRAIAAGTVFEISVSRELPELTPKDRLLR